MSTLENEAILEEAADNCPECMGDAEVRVEPLVPEEESYMVPCKCQDLGSLPEPMECGATEGDR